MKGTNGSTYTSRTQHMYMLAFMDGLRSFCYQCNATPQHNRATTKLHMWPYLAWAYCTPPYLCRMSKPYRLILHLSKVLLSPTLYWCASRVLSCVLVLTVVLWLLYSSAVQLLQATCPSGEMFSSFISSLTALEFS